jgi:hypothetical protein
VSLVEATVCVTGSLALVRVSLVEATVCVTGSPGVVTVSLVDETVWVNGSVALDVTSPRVELAEVTPSAPGAPATLSPDWATLSPDCETVSAVDAVAVASVGPEVVSTAVGESTLSDDV